MKVSELVRFIKSKGCHIKRHGAEHDIWINPETSNEVPIPRHSAKEIHTGTVNKILKKLGLK